MFVDGNGVTFQFGEDCSLSILYVILQIPGSGFVVYRSLGVLSFYI